MTPARNIPQNNQPAKPGREIAANRHSCNEGGIWPVQQEDLRQAGTQLEKWQQHSSHVAAYQARENLKTAAPVTIPYANAQERHKNRTSTSTILNSQVAKR